MGGKRILFEKEYKTLYGISNSTGKMLFIDDVPNGLACDCVCPKCGCQLEARNRGEIRVHHFAHYTPEKASHTRISEENPVFCTINAETVLHRAAKQVFKEALGKQMRVPGEYFVMLGKTFCIAEERTINITSVDTETSFEDIIPDITLRTNEGSTIFVEIYVSHKVDANKRTKLKTIGIPCIEINLGDISTEKRIPWQELEDRLLGSNTHKKWVYTPFLDRLNDRKEHFDQIKYDSSKGGYPCILLPPQKQDYITRCRRCPFFAGEHNDAIFCSARQLIDMKDLSMDEKDVSILVERVKSDYLKDHNRQIWIMKNQAEVMIRKLIKGSSFDETIIETVWNMYDSFPSEAKKQVSNRSDLIKAKETLEKIKKEKQDQEAIRTVIESIDKIDHEKLDPSSLSSEIEARIEAARVLYNQLPRPLRCRVTNRHDLIKTIDNLRDLQKKQKEQQDVERVINIISRIDFRKTQYEVIDDDTAKHIEAAYYLFDDLPEYLQECVIDREELLSAFKRLMDQRKKKSEIQCQIMSQHKKDTEYSPYMREYYDFLDEQTKYRSKTPAKIKYDKDSDIPEYYIRCRKASICPMCGKAMIQTMFFPKTMECASKDYNEVYSTDEYTVICNYSGPRTIAPENRITIDDYLIIRDYYVGLDK